MAKRKVTLKSGKVYIREQKTINIPTELWERLQMLKLRTHARGLNIVVEKSVDFLEKMGEEELLQLFND